MLFMPPTSLFSSRASRRAIFHVFPSGKDYRVSQRASRGLRLTQVKARMSIVEGRDAHGKCRDKCGWLCKCDPLGGGQDREKRAGYSRRGPFRRVFLRQLDILLAKTEWRSRAFFLILRGFSRINMLRYEEIGAMETVASFSRTYPIISYVSYVYSRLSALSVFPVLTWELIV